MSVRGIPSSGMVDASCRCVLRSAALKDARESTQLDSIEFYETMMTKR